MQMLNVLIIVSIVLGIINVLYKCSFERFDGFEIFAKLVGLIFYVLAAFFGGSWALAIGVICGVCGNSSYLGDKDNGKKHPIRYFVTFVMLILYIIAVLIYDNGGVVQQVASNGVLMVK